MGQEVHRADLLGLFLKDPDEFLADDLPLVLRLGNASQLAQEARSRVDAAYIHMELVLHHLLHLVSLVLPQQSVVHKNARQLIAHRPLQKRCRHRTVHAAGQGQKHLAVADLLTDERDLLFDELFDVQRLTELSTPPDSARSTRPSPICRRHSATASSR